MRTLRITSFVRSPHQLAYTTQCAGLQFATSFWYESVNFLELEARYTANFMRRLYFLIVAFDANRLVSLKPEVMEFGPLADCVTPSFVQLWQEVFFGVWGQWRYENNLPHYHGPRLTTERHSEDAPLTVAVEAPRPRTLAFCGGGKDSLLAMQILHEAGERFDSLAYSHSIYGNHARQHELIDSLLDHSASEGRHRIWIYDDFLPSPVLALAPELGIKSLTAGETLGSAFAVLPLALAHGFTNLVLAHEKSADVGNMNWPVTGEQINHQWGKSFTAEKLLSQYIRQHLLTNVHYFSLLKPIHDAVIFSSLRDYLHIVPATHSCNVSKPWCKRCAKCAYVWLNYAAYLPPHTVRQIFGENLFDIEENMLWFRQMIGLEAHTPFECVGQIEESRLAFQLCRAQGYEGKAMTLYAEAFPEGCAPEAIESFFLSDPQQHLIPAHLDIVPRLQRKAQRGREYVRQTLGW